MSSAPLILEKQSIDAGLSKFIKKELLVFCNKNSNKEYLQVMD